MEPVGLKSYMLIRVGLDVEEDAWFGLKLGLPEENAGQDPEEKPKGGRGQRPEETAESRRGRNPEEKPKGGKRRNRWRLRYKEERSRKAEQEAEGPRGWRRMLGRLRNPGGREGNRPVIGCGQERARLLAEREERVRQAQLGVERLSGEIAELANEWRGCNLVYEGRLRKVLAGGTSLEGEKQGDSRGHVLRELWSRYFDMREFQDYTKRFWVNRLLPYACLDHYVILGTAGCIYEIIEERANRMKSLRWMLLKADCGQELEDFVEDFYTEYGLAIELCTFESAEAFRKMRPLCSEPSNILDFSGDVCPSVTEAAKGSIWLDMLSLEEKKYRLQRRGAEVEYISLKTEWRRAKRRCHAPDLGLQ